MNGRWWHSAHFCSEQTSEASRTIELRTRPGQAVARGRCFSRLCGPCRNNETAHLHSSCSLQLLVHQALWETSEPVK